jgi:hypothetical protein
VPFLPARFRRRARPQPSAEELEQLGVGRGERVLAAGRVSGGGWAVGTGTALVLAGHRLDWTDVAHAEWDPDATTLRVQPMPGGAQRPAVVVVELDDPGSLPEVLRERVTASIVASRHVAVRGQAGVRVVARRPSGGQALAWQVVADRGIDPDAPDVRAVVEATIAAMKIELGD